jgi:recombinational DNA repair protein RecT
MEQVKNLSLDMAYKADFTSSLVENRKKVSVLSAEKIWKGFLKTAALVERECGFRNVRLSLDALRDVGLAACDKGLSLDDADAEAFIGFGYNENDAHELKLGIKYRGLRRLLLSTELVKRLTSNVIFDGDQFTWKGDFSLPEILSDGRGGIVVGAYACIEQYNGDVISVLLRQDELFQLEQMDIQRVESFYGSKEHSFYCTPWRNRMFEIAALKALYRKCADIMDITSDIDTAVFGSSNLVGNV